MLSTIIRFSLLVGLFSLSTISYTQSADMVMTVDFYTVMNNLERGNNLQGVTADNRLYFSWNGSRYVSTNEFNLPLRDRLWIKLDFMNRAQTRYLPVRDVIMTTDDEVQTYSDFRYLYYPGRDWIRGDRLVIHFNHQGYRYQAVLNINWLSADDRLPSTYVLPVINTQISRASAPAYVEPGWSVQIAARKDRLPSSDKYDNARAFGKVYAVKDGSWYKVRVGPFPDQASANAVRNQLRRLSGYSSAFVASYDNNGAYAEWVSEADNSRGVTVYDNIPPANSSSGYAIQIASLRRAPQLDKYDHLRGYRVYYRDEGSAYKVLVGPYPSMASAEQVRRRLLSSHPSAFIKQEAGNGTQFLIDTQVREYDNVPVRRVYQVRRGDTLYGIASRHGLTVDQLRRLNGLSDSNRIFSGQRLYVD